MNSTPATGGAPSPLFVTGLLLVLFAAAAGIAFVGLRLQRAEGEQLLVEVFGTAPALPFGLVPTGAATNANQQRSVRLARPLPAEGLDAPTEPTDEPNEVIVVRYAGPRPVERLFAPSMSNAEDVARRVEAWRTEPTDDFEVVVGTGEIQFGRWRVDHMHVRLYFADGSFQDVVRVNASIGDFAQVLFAFWPRGSETADPQRLVPLLAAIRFDALWEEHQARKSAGADVERGADAATNIPR